jgi:hypothetical protein
MTKQAGDIASVGLILATLLEFMPHVAAVLAIIWWAMRIYQTRLEIKREKEKKDDGHSS